MRIISQDSKLDLPYEMCIVNSNYRNENIIVAAIAGCGEFENICQMAKYSTKAKAIKAMEMLREQYMRWKCFSVLASGTCEHMENSFSSKEFSKAVIKFCKMNIFQFPKDEDLEVED